MILKSPWRRGALLLSTGLCKGDRLAIVIPEPQDFVLTFLGAVMAGIVPVPVARAIQAWRGSTVPIPLR